jgi:hypothetical protein
VLRKIHGSIFIATPIRQLNSRQFPFEPSIRFTFPPSPLPIHAVPPAGSRFTLPLPLPRLASPGRKGPGGRDGHHRSRPSLSSRRLATRDRRQRQHVAPTTSHLSSRCVAAGDECRRRPSPSHESRRLTTWESGTPGRRCRRRPSSFLDSRLLA